MAPGERKEGDRVADLGEAVLKPQAPPSRKPEAGAEMLAGRSPEEILRSICNQDPLGVRAICAEAVRDLAVFVDLDIAAARSFAYVASGAPGYREDEPLDAWLRGRAEQAVMDLVREEEERERSGDVFLETEDRRYDFLCHTLQIRPSKGRAAAVAFNGLAKDVRQAFFELVIHVKPIQTCVDEGMGSHAEIGGKVLRGFEALFGAKPGDLARAKRAKMAKEDQ